MNQISLTNQPIDLYTVLQLVLYNKNSDVPLKTVINTTSCCKFFNEFTSKGELENDYWKDKVKYLFESFLDKEQINTDTVWKKLFFNYTNEFSKITTKCLKLIENNKKSFKTKLCTLIRPHITNFNLMYSNKVTIYCLNFFADLNEGPFNYFKLSANHGFAMAQYKTAQCYRRGYYTEKNEEEALRYYQLAANQKHVRAKLYLAKMHYNLAENAPNRSEAFKYYKLVADRQDIKDKFVTSAQVEMASFYSTGNGVKADPELAAFYLKLAADRGDGYAQQNLGFCYKKGEGVPKSPEKAFKYFNLAANQKFSISMYELGNCYYSGSGTEKDLQQALKYYHISALHGLIQAKEALKNNFPSSK